MSRINLAPGVSWVGAVDWNIRDFHGYTTSRGTSYNAYLIKDEKIVLVDTVKHNFAEELLNNISRIVEPSKIDYIIVNHVEMDHSSALPAIAKIAKDAVIVASQRGKEAIAEHYEDNFNVKTVKTGDSLELGTKTLRFIEAPMLHWPDSMFTFLVEDGVLMPNDAFGQHLASSKRFDDEVDEHLLMEEAKKYYANILMPLGPLITRKIQELNQMSLVLRVIAPSHGIIWRSDPMRIVKAYLEWSGDKPKKKAVIVYDTMWGSTDKMARAIAEGISHEDIEVRLIKLRSSDLTEAVTEILDAQAVLVGSPTLNNQMFPTVAAFMNYITGLKPRGKLWWFFGSFGWGGGSARSMMEQARKAGFQVGDSTVEVRYVPDVNDLKKCSEFGRQVALEIKAR